MKTNQIQLRGHCQCCGNQQAVLYSGKMSKHGYTVEHGWFQGVCQGQSFKPMEQDRAATDKIVSDVRQQVANLLQHTQDLRDGKVFPATCQTGNRVKVQDEKRGRMVWKDEYIAFKDGKEYYQHKAVEHEIFKSENRARKGESFAAYLEKVVNGCHGKELIQVAKKEQAKWIEHGEQRMGENGKVLTSIRQEGARVYFTYDETRSSWMGTQAWRKLQLIGQQL